jgi:hypothetical protein
MCQTATHVFTDLDSESMKYQKIELDINYIIHFYIPRNKCSKQADSWLCIHINGGDIKRET